MVFNPIKIPEPVLKLFLLKNRHVKHFANMKHDDDACASNKLVNAVQFF